MNNVFELIYMARQNDDYAIRRIMSMYQGVINHIITSLLNKFSHFNSYRDDLTQEAYIVLSNCINTYREDKNVLFVTFVYTCVAHRVSNIIRSSSYDTQKANYNITSLDEIDSKINMSIMETIEQKDAMSNPEYALSYKMAVSRVNEAFSQMSKKDQEVLQAYLKGYSYREGAKKLKITEKNFDYRMQKTKKIIKGAIYLNEEA